jgi:hypothetical protein
MAVNRSNAFLKFRVVFNERALIGAKNVDAHPERRLPPQHKLISFASDGSGLGE